MSSNPNYTNATGVDIITYFIIIFPRINGIIHFHVGIRRHFTLQKGLTKARTHKNVNTLPLLCARKFYRLTL